MGSLNRRAVVALSGCLLLALASCGLLILFTMLSGRPGFRMGDNSHSVVIKNETGEAVILYDCDRSAPACRKPMAAGQILLNAWVIPFPTKEGRIPGRRRIEADDLDGNLVFCRIYAYEELVASGWEIRIVKGELAC